MTTGRNTPTLAETLAAWRALSAEDQRLALNTLSQGEQRTGLGEYAVAADLLRAAAEPEAPSTVERCEHGKDKAFGCSACMYRETKAAKPEEVNDPGELERRAEARNRGYGS